MCDYREVQRDQELGHAETCALDPVARCRPGFRAARKSHAQHFGQPLHLPTTRSGSFRFGGYIGCDHEPDQVVAALSGLGITDASLTGEFSTNPTTLSWNFSYTAPLSSLTAAVGSITKLQQAIAQSNSGLTLTFTVEGTQVSQQLRQAQACSNSDLIADATAQAQKLAAAAGLSLGPILRFSNAPRPLLQPTSFGAFEFSGELSAFPTGTGGLGNALIGFLVTPPPSPVTCSLVVKFQLLP